MIRKIQPGDRQIFLQLSEEFYHSNAVLAPVPPDYHELAFDEMMRSEAYLTGYIFEVDGEPAGFALLNRTFGHEAGGIVVWIEELYVRPAYRGQGIGRAFFELLFRSVPAARYRLETEPENLGARRLYQKLGFDALPYLQMYLDA